MFTNLLCLSLKSIRLPLEDELLLPEAERLVFEQIIAALLSGQRVEVRGFGSFVLRLRAARSVRNPKTGAVAQQKPSYVLHFKPGKALRERVDQSLIDA